MKKQYIKIPKFLQENGLQVGGANLQGVGILSLLAIGIPFLIGYLTGAGTIIILGLMMISSLMLFVTVLATPPNQGVGEYAQTLLTNTFSETHITSDRHVTPQSTDTDVRPDGGATANVGEASEQSPLSVISRRAEDVTRVKRAHPEDDCIERVDGGYVRILSVTPTNMAFITREERERRISGFERLLNGSNMKLQPYVRTTDFDVDEHTKYYNDRLEDSDVKSNPVLESLIKSYKREMIGRRMRNSGASVREYYMVIEITDDELESGVDLSTTASDRILSRLTFGLIGTRTSELDEMKEKEIHNEKIEQLTKREQTVVRDLERVTGVSVSRLSTAQMMNLLKKTWSGRGYDSATLTSDKYAQKSTTQQSVPDDGVKTTTQYEQDSEKSA